MSAITTTDPRVVRSVLGRLATQNINTAVPAAKRIAQVADKRDGAKPMTDPQANYIRSLIEKLATVNAEQAARVATWFGNRAETMTSREASTFIDQLKERTAAAPADAPAEPRKFDDFDDVHDGNYAIMRDAETDHVDFYRVSREQGKGKWTGRTFVKVQERAGGDLYPIEPKGRQFAILREIRAAGPQASAELYASKEDRCYACNTQLTDSVSRSLHIGPECRRKGKGF